MTCKHTRDWRAMVQLQSERACPSWWHIFFTLSRACWTCRWPDGTSPPLIRSYGKRCTLGEFERIFCKPPQQWTTSGMFLLQALALPCQSTPLAGYEWFDDLWFMYESQIFSMGTSYLVTLFLPVKGTVKSLGPLHVEIHHRCQPPLRLPQDLATWKSNLKLILPILLFLAPPNVTKYWNITA